MQGSSYARKQRYEMSTAMLALDRMYGPELIPTKIRIEIFSENFILSSLWSGVFDPFKEVQLIK